MHAPLMRPESSWDEFVVDKWYGRAPAPYIELNTLQAGGRIVQAYVYPLQLIACWVLLIAGAAISFIA